MPWKKRIANLERRVDRLDAQANILSQLVGRFMRMIFFRGRHRQRHISRVLSKEESESFRVEMRGHGMKDDEDSEQGRRKQKALK